MHSHIMALIIANIRNIFDNIIVLRVKKYIQLYNLS